MIIQVDLGDKRPIYEQIIEKMQNLIVRGILATDDKIPSVRNMAIELSINPNTIQKAYQELERMGYIYTVKGRGNFVSAPGNWRNDRKADYIAELSGVVKELKAMGVSRQEIIDCVEVEFDGGEV